MFARAALTFAAAFVLGTTGAQAAPTIDQSQTTFDTGIPFAFNFGSILDNTPVGQSFTVGLRGTLTTFRVIANTFEPSGSLSWELRAGAGLGGSVLGSGVGLVPCTVINGFCLLDYDVSSLGLAVLPGQKFTFLFTQASGPVAFSGILGTTNDLYSGGRIFVGAGYGDQPGWDLTFQTFVEPTVVPEPASWALLIAGFAMTGSVLRRRRFGSAAHG